VTRLASITTVYALLAAVLVAAPLAASDRPAPPAGSETLAGAPVEQAGEQAAEPVEDPVEGATEPAPESPAQSAPATEPAPAEPAPAAAEAVAAEPPAVPAEAPAEPAEAAAAEPADGRGRGPGSKLTVAAAAASGSVTISDFQFAPASITVDVGDTVTWSNDGPTAHSATATGGSFDTGIFPEGQSRSHTFTEAGTFAYICTPHPQMKGTVTVRAAAAQSGGEEGSSGDTSDSAVDPDSSTTTDDTQSAAGGADAATLPSTGLDAGGLLVLGVITLALGVLLRRRAVRTG
jgi:plastocyanin